jgi:hypothetical protein
MSDPGPARDLFSRALAVMVRLLPSHRSEWGRAMQAELAALDDVRARRRYALGCARAVLRDRTAMRTVAAHSIALTFGVVALSFAISIRVVGVRIQTIAFVVALGVLAWAGGRSGPLGPIAEDRLARRIRSGGYAVLGAYIMPALASIALASPQHDRRGLWAYYLALTLYLATVLFATARHTAAPARCLRLISALTIAGSAAWWVPMLLYATVRAHPSWALLSVAVTALLGLVVATVQRWPSRQAALAALASGVATCLLIFLAAQSTYLLDPQLVPDLGHVPGMTATGQVAQNRAEAVDPYVAELLLGAVLGAVLIAGISARRPVPPTDTTLPVT